MLLSCTYETNPATVQHNAAIVSYSALLFIPLLPSLLCLDLLHLSSSAPSTYHVSHCAPASSLNFPPHASSLLPAVLLLSTKIYVFPIYLCSDFVFLFSPLSGRLCCARPLLAIPPSVILGRSITSMRLVFTPSQLHVLLQM